MAGKIYHKWNGTVLTITSDSGTSSSDLQGAQGETGIRGAQGAPGVITDAQGELLAPAEDYYLKTEADAAINNSVSTAKEEVEKKIDKTAAALNSRIDIHDKRISNLENWISPEYFVTDDAVAFAKAIPDNALEYVQINRIGGMTYASESRNLLPYPYVSDSKTENGVTWTVRKNGSIEVTGTATGTIDFTLCEKQPIPTQPFTVNIECEGADVDVTLSLLGSDEETPVEEFIFSSADGATTYSGYSDVTSYSIHLDFSNFDGTGYIYPMVNEGSSALHYEPYDKSLLFNKVTAIGGSKVNLIPCPYAEGNKVENNITWEVNEEDGLIIATRNEDSTRSSSFMVCEKQPFSADILTIWNKDSGKGATSEGWVEFYDAAGEYVGEEYLMSGDYTTLDMQRYYPDAASFSFGISFYGKNEGDSIVFQPMVYEGEFINSYEPPYNPYFIIPSEIWFFEGYGDGLNSSYCNYIEWGEDGRTYCRTVCRVVFDGTEDWTLSGGKLYYKMPLKSFHWQKSPVEAKCNLYDYNTEIMASNTGTGFVVTMNNIYVKDSRFTKSSAEFEAHLAKQYAAGQPLTVVYALETPIVTDISDILPEDNLLSTKDIIKRLYFKNADNVDVPSSITYQLKGGTI